MDLGGHCFWARSRTSRQVSGEDPGGARMSTPIRRGGADVHLPAGGEVVMGTPQEARRRDPGEAAVRSIWQGPGRLHLIVDPLRFRFVAYRMESRAVELRDYWLAV